MARVHRPSVSVNVSVAGEADVTVRVKTRRPRPRKPQGVVLYRGPSELDGTPVVAVATAIARRSKNPKTGGMIQTYILADNGEDPIQAARSGGDAAVCGDCPHRPVNGKLGSCYVNLIQGPL